MYTDITKPSKPDLESITYYEPKSISYPQSHIRQTQNPTQNLFRTLSSWSWFLYLCRRENQRFGLFVSVVQFVFCQLFTRVRHSLNIHICAHSDLVCGLVFVVVECDDVRFCRHSAVVVFCVGRARGSYWVGLEHRIGSDPSPTLFGVKVSSQLFLSNPICLRLATRTTNHHIQSI